MKLYVVADNQPVAVLARWFVPNDAHHVGRLEFVRYVYRRTGWRPLRSVKVLRCFLTETHLVLTGYMELVFDASF